MRPTTKYLLHAPLGDFPYMRRMFPLLKGSLGILATETRKDEKILLCLYWALLDLGDRTTDYDIQYHAQDKFYNFKHHSVETIQSRVGEAEDACRVRCGGVPIYGSTSDKSRAYWKERTYGLTAAQKADEATTEFRAVQPGGGVAAAPALDYMGGITTPMEINF